ncbi:MAG: hypothetical protein AAFN81_22110 [Bacteroidota bacterium]
MKNVFNLMLLLILALSLQGCFSMQEEVWIEADGSGRMEATTDLSSLYPFLMMGLEQELSKEKDGDGKSEEGMEEDGDPFTAIMKDAMRADKIDTIFNFREMIEDGLKQKGMTWEMMMDTMRSGPNEEGLTEEQQDMAADIMEEIADTRIRMQADRDEQTFKWTSIQDFISVEETGSMGNSIMEMMNMMEEISGEAGLGQRDEMDAIMSQLFEAQTSLQIDGNTLRIRRAGMDLSMLGDEAEQSMGMIKMFLGNEPYRMILHFPGKVKKISSPIAEKVDKTTVAIEIPFNDLFDPETLIDVEVQFKGLKKR